MGTSVSIICDKCYVCLNIQASVEIIGWITHFFCGEVDLPYSLLIAVGDWSQCW